MTLETTPHLFPNYAEYDKVVELKNPVFGWSYFEERFAQYSAAATKKEKPAPFIMVKHAPTADGTVNGSFVVTTPAELRALLFYLPENSTVLIGYYAGAFYGEKDASADAE